MSAPKNPRITLDPEAYHALCIQAAIEQTSPGSLASRVILSYSQEAKVALQTARRDAPSVTESQAPKEGERKAPKEGVKKVRLFQNPQALAEIKRLWEGGQRNQAEISRAIGYNKATVNDNIRRMIKAGTLSPLEQ